MKTQKIRVLGVIPARGGSKGIKNKNLYSISGKPLIAYTIESACKSKLLDDFILSTDSELIAKVALRYKAKVPFLRPKELAQDDTPTRPVLKHALQEYEKLTGKYFDWIMLLQPTVPFRTSENIDTAIQLLKKYPKKGALISCFDGEDAHPQVMYKKRSGKVVPFVRGAKEMMRRQNFEKVYVRNGAIYLTKRDILLRKDRIISNNPLIMEMSRWGMVNINSIEDMRLAEMFLLYKKIRPEWF